MVVATIVLTLGVPSFRELINNNRLTSGANEFVTALNLARSEAIKRSVRVTVCKSANGTTCTTSGGYQQGWIVFADPNGNATVDANELPVIRAYGALSGGLTLIGNVNVANYVSFVPAGISQLSIPDGGGFQAGTLTLCKSGYTTSSRQMVLSRGGRVQVQRSEPAAGCP
jgi:type IV fimbrial biogenesis protein FimT